MVKNRHYGNECFGLARDRIEVFKMILGIMGMDVRCIGLARDCIKVR